jgi:hypothetical protein
LHPFLDDDERKILYFIIHKAMPSTDEPYTAAEAVNYLGQLGGYKRAPSDGMPGLKSICHGLFLLYFLIDLFVGQG